MRFAHMADVHLGFQKGAELQRIEREAFEEAVDACISSKVDFVLVSGDLFHVNIPEMRVQRYAFAKFRELHGAGIPAYAVYGSHDFSPVSNSVIDLLEETGYITKMVADAAGDGGTGKGGGDGLIRPRFVTDPGTGARIAGLSGLKASRDTGYYRRLDRAYLESEPGFKIFMFHGALSEMVHAEGGDHMPESLLPAGFDYYAGGHMHRYADRRSQRHIVYPGTPFAGYHSDLEESAEGTVRGIVMVDTERATCRLHPIRAAEYGLVRIRVDGRTAEAAGQELLEACRSVEAEGRVIVLRVHGDLASGGPADVGVDAACEELERRGARATDVRNAARSPEYAGRGAPAADVGTIPDVAFGNAVGDFRLEYDRPGDRRVLLSKGGVVTAKALFVRLKAPRLDNEGAVDYERRITGDALSALGVEP